MDERVSIAPDASDRPTQEAIVSRARQRGFQHFIVPAGLDLPATVGEEVLVREGALLRRTAGPPAPLAVTTVSSPDELDRALSTVPDRGIVVLEWSGDRVIPLENAVARRSRRFDLWTYARNVREVPAALGALEHGADRVIVSVHAPAEIDELESVLDRTAPVLLDWTRLPLRSIRPVGLGDRVLVDTTSILRPEEGLLVGSTAAVLFHVASEAVGSRFSRPRPFRVNAGAAHSYVLMADGSTRYLSELVAGDAVLVAAPGGRHRPARVGRVKIERRPMTMLAGDDAGHPRTIFLQEAETVRVSTDRGRLAVTELEPGPSLEAVRLPPARHLGTAVEETVEER